MTMQVRDGLQFEGERWAIWGRAGEGYFDPQTYGLKVDSFISTACYRGYYSTYSIKENLLQLDDLEINLDEANAPLLNGCVPEKIEKSPICGHLRYLNLGLAVAFSGGLLLCQGWVSKLPCSLGPELAWGFQKVKELNFDNGQLMNTYDRSEEIEQVRQYVEQNIAEFDIDFSTSQSREDSVKQAFAKYEILEARINSCFKFNY